MNLIVGHIYHNGHNWGQHTAKVLSLTGKHVFVELDNGNKSQYTIKYFSRNWPRDITDDIKVDRFDPEIEWGYYDENYAVMEKQRYGEYVLYTDYERIYQELQELKKER